MVLREDQREVRRRCPGCHEPRGESRGLEQNEQLAGDELVEVEVKALELELRATGLW